MVVNTIKNSQLPSVFFLNNILTQLEQTPTFSWYCCFMLQFFLWYFVLATPFTNQLQHWISYCTRSFYVNCKSNLICLSMNPIEQFVFIFPCLSTWKEMSCVHFVVMKFGHTGIVAKSLNFNGSLNFNWSFNLRRFDLDDRSDNTRFSVNRIITHILNHSYK